jgi:predicted RNA-binding protein YlqC (UPF0109 family)
MSAFDDEFGLFGDEAPSTEEEERRPTLGARKIASSETIIDEIEPEDDAPPRRRSGTHGGPGGLTGRRGSADRRPRRAQPERAPLSPEVAQARAKELLTFLARGLVSKPDAVAVEAHPDHRGTVLELEVDPEDLGKVIGRAGRVAQALRTLVRAGAEGRVTIDIIDVDEDEDEEEGAHPGDAASNGRHSEAAAEDEDAE